MKSTECRMKADFPAINVVELLISPQNVTLVRKGAIDAINSGILHAFANRRNKRNSESAKPKEEQEI